MTGLFVAPKVNTVTYTSVGKIDHTTFLYFFNIARRIFVALSELIDYLKMARFKTDVYLTRAKSVKQ